MTHAKVQVGTEVTVLRAALTNEYEESYALFQNDAADVADTVYLKTDGTTPVAGEGIRLNGGGGSYEMSRALGNWRPGVIRAIKASGNANILVTRE